MYIDTKISNVIKMKSYILNSNVTHYFCRFYAYVSEGKLHGIFCEDLLTHINLNRNQQGISPLWPTIRYIPPIGGLYV